MFDKKYKYRVLLKGGGSFNLEASDLELSWDDATGDITSYNFKNPTGEVPCYLHPSNIATIVEVKG
jgi:hypothetical protein